MSETKKTEASVINWANLASFFKKKKKKIGASVLLQVATEVLLEAKIL